MTIQNQTFETPNTPAILSGIRDILAEYQEKLAKVEGFAADFSALVKTIESGCCVKGTFANDYAFDRGAPSISADRLRRVLLKSGWRAAFNYCKMEKLVSPREKAKFARLLENPPELNLEAIREHFGDYLGDHRYHMLRGFAEVFCDLDQSYKSHSRVKVGVEGLPKRLIFTYVTTGYCSAGMERIGKMINALHLYWSKPLIDYRVLSPLENYLKALANGTETENPYPALSFKAYRNGNVHVIFTPAILRDINMVLAEFYGDVLPDAEVKDAARTPGTALAKDLQFYRSTENVVTQAVALANLKTGMKVLEPSCGDGAILDAIRQYDRFGIEAHAGRAAQARDKGHPVHTANFLELAPDPVFDRVIMNPPFYGTHYLKHVHHAADFLKDGGTLVAVLPASAWIDHKDDLPEGGFWHPLPYASFKESGTNICTGIFIWHKRNR